MTERWTKQDEAYMRKVWSTSIPKPEIANHLGKSLVAVRAKAYRMKLSFEVHLPFSKDEDKEIWELVSQGLSCRDIAMKLNRSEYSIRGRLWMQDKPLPTLDIAGDPIEFLKRYRKKNKKITSRVSNAVGRKVLKNTGWQLEPAEGSQTVFDAYGSLTGKHYGIEVKVGETLTLRSQNQLKNAFDLCVEKGIQYAIVWIHSDGNVFILNVERQKVR